MDNLSAHKSALAREIVAARQASIRYLPAYSPDLNLIEKMWSKVKQILRGIKARPHEELFAGVGIALDLVSAANAEGWFASCGYI
jgi:transposase